MNIAAIAQATAMLRAVVDEYSGPGAEIVASIDVRQPAPNSCQRRWPVSIESTALMPVLRPHVARTAFEIDSHRNALHDLDPVA